MIIIGNGFADLQNSNKPMVSFILAVISYNNSLKNQNFVNFSDFPNLSNYGEVINTILSNAKSGHGYNIDNLQNMLISFYDSVEKYCEEFKLAASKFNNLPTEVLPSTLRVLAKDCLNHQSKITNIQSLLKGYYSAFSEDDRNFISIVSELNTVVGGDNIALENIRLELKNIQNEIDSVGTTTVGSALGIAAGALMTCVGAIGEFFSGGASTAVVLGGIGLLTSGIAGEAASATQLIELNNAKASLLKQEDNLETEVKIAAAISHGFSSLITQVDNAESLSFNVSNALDIISSDLNEVAYNLESGATSADEVIFLFMEAANTDVSSLLLDLEVIKEQVSSFTTHCASQNQTVSELIASLT